MAKKLFLHGMEDGKGWLRGLMWGMGLVYYLLLISPLYAKAEMCTEIDYNIKTIASGLEYTVGLKEDGTVVATGVNDHGQLNVSDWTNIRQPACLNNPPVANAGPDQGIECAGPSGASVTLNGSTASDTDGDLLTYT